jgi:CubicO group peptidase (beta-lactamase class C family)
LPCSPSRTPRKRRTHPPTAPAPAKLDDGWTIATPKDAGVDPDDPTIKHDVMSISKSVTSLLIGIARGEGTFPDLDAPAIDHLPATYADLRTPDNARFTIRALLTMSSGRDWNEHRPYSDPQNAAIQMLRPRDMAKLGQLLLTDGQWNGRQVIPKGWVAESTQPRIKAYVYSYGNQWWATPS